MSIVSYIIIYHKFTILLQNIVSRMIGAVHTAVTELCADDDGDEQELSKYPRTWGAADLAPCPSPGGQCV
jgi:hypothetical protein